MGLHTHTAESNSKRPGFQQAERYAALTPDRVYESVGWFAAPSTARCVAAAHTACIWMKPGIALFARPPPHRRGVAHCPLASNMRPGLGHSVDSARCGDAMGVKAWTGCGRAAPPIGMTSNHLLDERVIGECSISPPRARRNPGAQ